MRRTSSLLLLAMLSVTAAGQDNLLVNGNFEQNMSGWNGFWSRDRGGAAKIVTQVGQQAQKAVQIRYAGEEDWSFQQSKTFDVVPGDIFELSGRLKITGPGRASLSVVLNDSDGENLSWDYGGRPVRNLPDWKRIQRRFMIPPNGAAIIPRLMGVGPVEASLTDVSLVKIGTLDKLAASELPDSITIESEAIKLSFDPQQACCRLLDKRTGKQHTQYPNRNVVVLSARAQGKKITLQLLKPDDVLKLDATITLDDELPEFLVEIVGKGEMFQPLRFPSAFATKSGEFLILPVNEGISYPVDDQSLPNMAYHMYGGHGLCMAFHGSTNLQQGLMSIVETPDDARVEIPRRDERLCLAPEWVPQKQQFGTARRIRYVLLNEGGYVAMCKRYRQYALQTGRFKTLAQKRAENPNVDKLIGAVNVWCWSTPGDEMCQELKSLGIERILWSRRSKPDEIQRMNKMGVLTSRYDIFQDVQNPANFSKLRYIHPDWPTEAWPDHLIVDMNGALVSGWKVKGQDGQWYPCGVLCDSVAVEYAKKRVPAELETHAYQSRFIDTTTAASWRECYHPDHPMTRSDSRRHRMELLEFMSDTCGLVTGSETGHDASVPYVHYFEGMLSLGPYRVPDAGRAMMDVVHDVPERVAKFQTGHKYRLPLWELVYHDCVVAQWYWGDYNNKLPALWDRRDLWNALYGTPPMFMFNGKIWRENRERFVQSYHTATPVARATGYSEMLAHRWLTADHRIQQTEFANGVKVTINFGDQAYEMSDGHVIPALGKRVIGIEE